LSVRASLRTARPITLVIGAGEPRGSP
jgi:hypothetical protein